MNYRKIYSKDISISEIGLGCWAIGGPNFEHGTIPSGWSHVNNTEAIAGIHEAMESGVTHFDNADCYGDGRAEQILGEAIESDRQNLIVASKVGWINNGYDHPYRAENIRQQCEASLRNLKTDYLDLYYFHHGDFGKGDQYLPEAVDTFQTLLDEGKIRAIGLSTYSQKQFRRLIPKIKPDAVQCWAHLMDSHFIAKNSILQQLCEEYLVSIVGFQPFNQGLLLGKYDYQNPPQFGDGDHRSKLEKFSPASLKRVHNTLEMVTDRFGNSADVLASVALQFVLNHANVSGSVMGFRNKKQVRQNLTCSKSLNGSDMSFLYNLFRK